MRRPRSREIYFLRYFSQVPVTTTTRLSWKKKTKKKLRFLLIWQQNQRTVKRLPGLNQPKQSERQSLSRKKRTFVVYAVLLIKWRASKSSLLSSVPAGTLACSAIVSVTHREKLSTNLQHKIAMLSQQKNTTTAYDIAIIHKFPECVATTTCFLLFPEDVKLWFENPNNFSTNEKWPLAWKQNAKQFNHCTSQEARDDVHCSIN